jgi:tetratricopeptide (TPR) repeat protein
VNVRAALTVLREGGDRAWLEMAAELWRYWRIRGAPDEGRAVLELASSDATGELRGRLLIGLAAMEQTAGEDETALAHVREALELLADSEVQASLGEAQVRCAVSLFGLERPDEAEEHVMQAIRIARDIGDNWLFGYARNVDGWILSQRDDPDADTAFSESRDALLEVGDRITALHPRLNLIGRLLGAGKLVEAEREIAAARSEVAETGERVAFASLAEHETTLLLSQGHVQRALEHSVEFARRAREAGDVYYATIAAELTERIRAQLEADEEERVSGLA